LGVCLGHLNFNIHPFKENFNTRDRGAPKSAGPVAIATFATIVNPALGVMYKVKRYGSKQA